MNSEDTILSPVTAIKLYKRKNKTKALIIPHLDTIFLHGQLFQRKKNTLSRNTIGSERFNKKHYQFGEKKIFAMNN